MFSGLKMMMSKKAKKKWIYVYIEFKKKIYIDVWCIFYYNLHSIYVRSTSKYKEKMKKSLKIKLKKSILFFGNRYIPMLIINNQAELNLLCIHWLSEF